MTKRVYRLRRSGTLLQTFSAENKSEWRNNSGDTFNSTQLEAFEIPVEYATIYGGKGRFVKVNHPNGTTFPWRMPSSYTRGHQIIDLNASSSTLTWSTSFSKGTGTRIGVPNENLLKRGDWSRFMESRLDMSPLLTYNEMARNNISLRLKVKDASVNLSVFAAEAKKAATGLAKNFTDILGVYQAVRKGNFKKAVSFLKPDTVKAKGWSSRDAAGRWLELQYAILPLASDLKRAYDYLRETQKRVLTYSVSANYNLTVPQHSIEDSSSVSMQASGRRGVRTKCHYLIDDFRMREAARLGLINPLLVAWELVPYSFVIDWLVPVGNMIEALDATAGTVFISGTRTRWCDIDLTGTVKSQYQGYTDLPNSGLSAVPFSGKIYSIQREALLSYPMVLPYVKNPFSTGHLINAVALVRSLFKR